MFSGKFKGGNNRKEFAFNMYSESNYDPCVNIFTLQFKDIQIERERTRTLITKIMEEKNKGVLKKGIQEKMYEDMSKWCNNKIFSDVLFTLGEQRIPFYAHRIILSARCESFREEFAQDQNSEDKITINIEKSEPKIFENLMMYIYTNCVILTPETAVATMEISVEYCLSELTSLCIDYMLEIMCTENACLFLQAAVEYNEIRLQTGALAYIDEYAKDIFGFHDFVYQLQEDACLLIFSRDSLDLDEMDVYKTVEKWATQKSIDTKTPVSEVGKRIFAQVRYGLLSQKELDDIEATNNVPAKIIAGAWRSLYMATPKKPRKGTIPKKDEAAS